jgi:hypothetical protein
VHKPICWRLWDVDSRMLSLLNRVVFCDRDWDITLGGARNDTVRACFAFPYPLAIQTRHVRVSAPVLVELGKPVLREFPLL